MAARAEAQPVVLGTRYLPANVPEGDISCHEHRGDEGIPGEAIAVVSRMASEYDFGMEVGISSGIRANITLRWT